MFWKRFKFTNSSACTLNLATLKAFLPNKEMCCSKFEIPFLEKRENLVGKGENASYKNYIQ